VRLIYVDEAGTSVKEPVSVVVGIIIHADEQWKQIQSKVAEVLKVVPKHYRPDFIFHAKTVWGSEKYRQNWSMGERLTLLHKMMSLPRQLSLPIALGVVRRATPPPDNLPPSLPENEFHHAYAFWLCVCQADKFLRKHAGLNEIGTVVAEDVDMRKLLREVINVPELSFPVPQSSFTSPEISVSAVQEFKITRIVDTIHFVEKKHAPLLQIADACAYGFRRYFAGEKYGDDYVNSILGKKWNSVREDLTNPLGLLIRFQSPKRRFFSRIFSRFF
jgi:hypothetical protein